MRLVTAPARMIHRLAARRIGLAAAGGAAVLAALALGAAGAGPAAAATGPGWYGYAVTGSHEASVSADWNVPAAQCTASNKAGSSIWTGLDGYNSSSIEQVGMSVTCTGTRASYYGWYEVYPAAPVEYSATIHAGDSMAASVTANGANQFTLTLKDSTQGWSKTAKATLAGAALSSAETVLEDPGTFKWGTINFTGVKVNGTALGSDSPIKVTGPDSQIVVSPVTGSAFTVSWQ